ncbi:hypothetical protein [Hyphomicrobium sp. D-2]|uniref:hypothetical protein n=1 Tax=Hyphomicrobium sp. D-2 TaxID=3041621 RepID=UPI00245619C3|nr:hypothetical protein [Hyphomicrobium sp. D-2]MDH4982677.1 hypothetical protein [Hyphomicrobium sp. D-2]
MKRAMYAGGAIAGLCGTIFMLTPALALPVSALQQPAVSDNILPVQAGPGGPRGGGGAMGRGPGGGGRGMAGPRGGGRGFAGPRPGGGGPRFSGPRGPRHGGGPGVRPGRPGHAGPGRPGRPPHFRPRPPYGGGFYAPYGYYSYYGGGFGFDECRWFRQRALTTRSAYWWDRYYACVEDY